MSVKIIIKTGLFFSVLLLISCGENRLIGLESHVNQVIEKNKTEGPVILKMDTINSFEWDSLVVVGPYTVIDDISKEEGFDLDKIPNTISSHDSFFLIIFLNNKEGIKWIQIDYWAIVLKKLLRGDGNGYSIYPKSQSSFILNN